MTINFPQFTVETPVKPERPEPVEHVAFAPPSAFPPRRGFYRNTLKRALDIAVIVMAAPVVLPLIGAMACA